jgi:glycosyltransferase involved in cell wall biosynthesis
VYAVRSFPTRRPTVSIGVPVYNGEDNLEAALDSLLEQTFEDFEIIISDNASTDGTEDICRRYTRLDNRVRYIRNGKNVGVARNYNRLFELSDGRYFKWAPHDDRLSPEFLARGVEVLDRDASASIVVPVPSLIDDEGRADDFERRHRESMAARGLRHVDVDDPSHLAHRDPCARFGDIVLRKVWFYELYGLIRADLLGRTGLLRLFHGSCQVLLAELALLGPVRQLTDAQMFMRYPTFKILDAKRDMAQKMDPEWSGRIFFPEVKVATEWLRVVGRSELRRTEKLRCVASVGRKVTRPDNLGKLVLPGPNNYLGINLSRHREPALKRR